jgi:hypothetical protein
VSSVVRAERGEFLNAFKCFLFTQVCFAFEFYFSVENFSSPRRMLRLEDEDA